MEKKTVAVMNSSREITDVLSEVFKRAGFNTTDIFTYKFKNGDVDFEEFVENNKPNVIVYDIAIPYKDNYELFQSLLAKDVAKDIPFILTTTNKKALEEIVGETMAIEIVGKPFDMNHLVDIVKNASSKKTSI